MTAMIIRILGEGQFDIAEEALDRLNELDSAVEAAIEADDETTFRPALVALLEGVRTVGVRHADDSLDESDLILPPDDASIAEVRQMLSDDGLIPG
ncbi:PspA-associated protein PspAA [Nocardioides dongxiaopingii]|jgi:hypothetical protein|uniref:PspA-associated protein PspAA n=1 Tax=Nocardioides TaxID=1839 RepID=UPI001FE82490|nr:MULTISPECIES: hypothetical protein [Nocardioides]